jgi:hypothetical protein
MLRCSTWVDLWQKMQVVLTRKKVRDEEISRGDTYMCMFIIYIVIADGVDEVVFAVCPFVSLL